MTGTIASTVLAWLLTYAIHSTLLLGLAFAITRRETLSAYRRDFIWKLAVGGMNQEVDINGGSAAALSSGAHIERPGGLLALSSNIGEYNRTKLVVMRDATLNIGYAITPNVKLNLGYNLFWVSSVIRPGEQIDLGVNPALLPFSGAAPSGPARPAFHFNGEEFWMHGINVGLSVQF